MELLKEGGFRGFLKKDGRFKGRKEGSFKYSKYLLGKPGVHEVD
jgi:hypothetical protein